MAKAKSQSPRSSNPKPAELTHAEAFATLQAEIAAVPDEALVNIITDIPESVQTAMGAAKRIEMLMPDLSRLPPDLFDLPRARNLRLYAGATLYSHLRLAEAGIPDLELRVILEEAVTLRDKLLTVAKALGTLGVVPLTRVGLMRRDRGHRSVASGLTALASFYETVWSQLGSPRPVTREQVERAAVLGAKLLQALGDRQLGSDRVEPFDEARRTRTRAYSLFMRAYGTCRQGVLFVRWRQGDADKFVPSLYRRHRRRVALVSAPEPDATIAS